MTTGWNSSVIGSGKPIPSTAITTTAPTSAPSLSTATTGGSLAAATYYVVYTWVSASGETTPSPEAQQATTGSTSTLTVTIPSLPAWATSANIYISTSSGTETKQGSTATTTYTQTGALTGGLSQPTVNTLTQSPALYTAPALSSNIQTGFATAELKGITITNTTSSTVKASIFIVPTAGTAGTGNAYWVNVPVNSGDAKPVQGLSEVLTAGDMIQVSASGAGLTIRGSIVEVQ